MPAARPSLPPKLKATSVPGCSFSKRSPSVVKLSFSEAAAKTVTVPVTPCPPDSADESEPDAEQALSASRAAAVPAPVIRRVRCGRVISEHSLWDRGRARRALPMHRSYWRICQAFTPYPLA
jgi:hypothetical protein